MIFYLFYKIQASNTVKKSLIYNHFIYKTQDIDDILLTLKEISKKKRDTHGFLKILGPQNKHICTDGQVYISYVILLVIQT